ncbi:hypothetical protein EN746_28270 [Mesorhizobium sp. M8A.F.Ca.ET.023.02.2.1]|nr:hypothetical protein EN746_28270 [Mesorhizobium sp. M8A.F.Ca.ET.023.02.2.1]
MERAERLRVEPPILCARQLRTCRKGSVELACSFQKQSLPHYCAVQHENARFKAKFFVTFSFPLG